LLSEDGSSVMAYKKNPKDSEQICALSAAVMSYHSMAGYAAANNLLERTLNESAIRRIFIPEAFLFTDHCLIKADKVISGLVINRDKIRRDLRTHGDFAGTGRLLVHLQQLGVPREEAYRMIQSCSLQAQDAVVRGEENPCATCCWKRSIPCLTQRPGPSPPKSSPRWWMPPAMSAAPSSWCRTSSLICVLPCSPTLKPAPTPLRACSDALTTGIGRGILLIALGGGRHE